MSPVAGNQEIAMLERLLSKKTFEKLEGQPSWFRWNQDVKTAFEAAGMEEWLEKPVVKETRDEKESPEVKATREKTGRQIASMLQLTLSHFEKDSLPPISHPSEIVIFFKNKYGQKDLQLQNALRMKINNLYQEEEEPLVDYLRRYDAVYNEFKNVGGKAQGYELVNMLNQTLLPMNQEKLYLELKFEDTSQREDFYVVRNLLSQVAQREEAQNRTIELRKAWKAGQESINKLQNEEMKDVDDVAMMAKQNRPQQFRRENQYEGNSRRTYDGRVHHAREQSKESCEKQGTSKLR
ncbi:hypothetical protein ROZALSC1DRAFT_25680 [Rozella allomycis CSF55]|uniref:Retrotransposon gag domain-containing protein n=1 Tax=Rozella allomycis (strain CSF55) TaxID=988480 RepID=A0A4P9YA47_ROZAC|nr:hypothetical protein ROZALSC1DRAFT_25680 [Rozella allomycis CSF55]